MNAVSREPVREFGGKIIGWVETDTQGNQEVRNFNGTIIARYDARIKITRDFYGRELTKGNTAMGQLFNPSINSLYGK